MSAASTEATVKDPATGAMTHHREASGRLTKNDGESTKSWKARLRPYLFIASLVVLSGVFIYYCIGFTIATSFTDWDGISE